MFLISLSVIIVIVIIIIVINKKRLFPEVSGYESHGRGSYPGIAVDHFLCSVHPARINRATAVFSFGGGVKAAEA